MIIARPVVLQITEHCGRPICRAQSSPFGRDNEDRVGAGGGQTARVEPRVKRGFGIGARYARQHRPVIGARRVVVVGPHRYQHQQQRHRHGHRRQAIGFRPQRQHEAAEDRPAGERHQHDAGRTEHARHHDWEVHDGLHEHQCVQEPYRNDPLGPLRHPFHTQERRATQGEGMAGQRCFPVVQHVHDDQFDEQRHDRRPVMPAREPRDRGDRQDDEGERARELCAQVRHLGRVGVGSALRAQPVVPHGQQHAAGVPHRDRERRECHVDDQPLGLLPAVVLRFDQDVQQFAALADEQEQHEHADGCKQGIETQPAHSANVEQPAEQAQRAGVLQRHGAAGDRFARVTWCSPPGTARGRRSIGQYANWSMRLWAWDRPLPRTTPGASHAPIARPT